MCGLIDMFPACAHYDGSTYSVYRHYTYIVPGEPRNVKLSPLNSTAISVNWKPPSNRDRHGLIRGFQIHVQEVNKAGDMVGEPLRYDVADENAETFNITDLQPDTEYSIQVIPRL